MSASFYGLRTKKYKHKNINYIKEINKAINEEKKYLIIKLIVNFINNYFAMEEDNIQIIFFTNHLYNIINNNSNI